MRLGAVLGNEGQQELNKHAERNARILRRQRKLAREAYINRMRNAGRIIPYQYTASMENW